MITKDELQARIEMAVEAVWSEYKKSLDNPPNWEVHFSVSYEVDDLCERIADAIYMNERIFSVPNEKYEVVLMKADGSEEVIHRNLTERRAIELFEGIDHAYYRRQKGE